LNKAERAKYGARLLSRLAERLTAAEFGKGFDASNLRYLRLFYKAFPDCDALRHELSWPRYRLLLQGGKIDPAALTDEECQAAINSFNRLRKAIENCLNPPAAGGPA
jgi:hypothetical protein